MVSETAAHQSEELRKRRSTRIVQAVPLAVTGVDALGRPFTERTSTLIINCHGCRYQSKHYVLKNMWVTLEVPHQEAGEPPRAVRGRVAWIQRPRTVRQLFQVALELEVPGNAWGIAFPPQDWFAFPEGGQAAGSLAGLHETPQGPGGTAEIHLPLTEPEAPAAGAQDNVRVFPTPVSATDASLQLARHMARLVADAKQQIQAAAREVAAQAVAAEHRVSMEDWDQRFTAAREELTGQLSKAIEKIQQESDTRARAAHAAAAAALERELPRWIAPQLEELTRELTQQISDRSAAERSEHTRQLASAVESIEALCRQAEESAARLRAQAEQTEAQIAARAEAATRVVDEAARQREQATEAQREALSATANQIQEQAANTLTGAEASWRDQLRSELEAAQVRWHSAIESALAAAHERAADGLNEHARTLLDRVQEEAGRQAAALRETLGGTAAEAEQKLAAMRNFLQEQSERLEAVLTRASQTSERLDQFSTRIETTQRQAMGGFESQLDDVLSLHRNELHRSSESLLEEIHSRIQATLEHTLRLALSRFDQEIASLVQPHISATEEAIQRLAGGRSLLDAALTLQQDHIRTSADEAFAESLARFREHLGGVDQILEESAQVVAARNLAEVESKVSELKRQTVDDLLKSAEWYEKKAQTQIQGLAEKSAEQAGNQLRERAGEVSGVFATELHRSSRNFIEHTQTEMEEVVRDSFERSRALFAEAADTTSAAFTDEIQRHARQELDGFGEEVRRSVDESRAQLDAARGEFSRKVTAEQEEFLRRFGAGMRAAVETGVADANQRVQAGFAPLVDSWKSSVEAHQAEMRGVFLQMSQQVAEQHRNRLENVSNQWMLATAASLDHQSRAAVANIGSKAEEKLRETCAQVFAGIGDTLRDRLQQIAASFTAPGTPQAQSQTAGGSRS